MFTFQLAQLSIFPFTYHAVETFNIFSRTLSDSQAILVTKLFAKPSRVTQKHDGNITLLRLLRAKDSLCTRLKTEH
jgi:hypothetical protein